MAIGSTLLSPNGAPACGKDAKALQFIEEMTRNADSVQERVLEEILSRNAEIEYLKRFQLNGATDRETFQSKIPVVTYLDLRPVIQRIADSDRFPILSPHPIPKFLTSSGTSAGERKLTPTIHEELVPRQLLYSPLMPVMNPNVPGSDKGKGLYFLFVNAEMKTPGGLVARPGLTSYYKSNHFKTRPYDPFNDYTSPKEAILCADSFQSMYTQMLCGLIMREDVLRVGAILASGLLMAIRFLKINWKQLAHDIATGTLNPKVTDFSIRECMRKILKPNPELAEFITKECSEGNWECIITRIWPNTKYLDVIVTGAMAQYIPILEYYSGGLPMACTMYASFVITTYAGLCPYRVGDILRVSGFHNAAPQFRFVRRKNLLSIESDKTDEAELQKAIENSSVITSFFNQSGSLGTQETNLAGTSTSMADSSWCCDSGSTHHITNAMENLIVAFEYSGTDKVHVANGAGIDIESIGYSSVKTQSKSLQLNNILYCPQITKNLLSVSEFCKDNNVLFEFHSDQCFVKDVTTGQVLLEGTLDGGLYKFDLDIDKSPAAAQNQNSV